LASAAENVFMEDASDLLLLLEFPVAGGETGHREPHAREAMEERRGWPSLRLLLFLLLVVVLLA
jgi:hypothetical protein